MKLVDRIHGSFVHGRRVQRLAQRLAGLIPARATVLDVGCGDGKLSRLLADMRPDVDVAGIDVLVRGGAHIPVAAFDGRTIPQTDQSVDVVLFIDVLHHTDDPTVLLREARRVARRAIVLKDHTADGFLSRPTLRFMDRAAAFLDEAYETIIPPLPRPPLGGALDLARPDLGDRSLSGGIRVGDTGAGVAFPAAGRHYDPLPPVAHSQPLSYCSTTPTSA